MELNNLVYLVSVGLTVNVKVRYYALFRELTNTNEEILNIEPNTTISKLLNYIVGLHPTLNKYISSGIYILLHNLRPISDHELDSTKLNDGDVIDVMPPPSGGSPYEVRLLKNYEKVVLDDVIMELKNAKGAVRAGAIGVYIGFVKGDVNGINVHELTYEVNEEYAYRVMDNILKDVMSRNKGLIAIKLYHRVGSYKPGDDVFYVFVLGVSRYDVIPALAEIVERVKHEAGIWKLEKRNDGVFWVIGDGVRIESKAKDLTKLTY